MTTEPCHQTQNTQTLGPTQGLGTAEALTLFWSDWSNISPSDPGNSKGLLVP